MGKFFVFLVIALCGANAILLDESSRIINGGIATENQFPYAVSIQRKQIGVAQPVATRGHRCGGVLIDLQFVLTTASCVTNLLGSTFVPINPSEYRVFAGSNLLTNDDVADRIRDIVNITTHPSFILNDIGVIQLASPFKASVAIQPIPIPDADFAPVDSTVCTVAGWGANSADPAITASVELRYASNYIYNQNLCALLYNSTSSLPNILPTMMCAASFDNFSPGCVGDLGNGLVCNNILSGILFLNQGCTPTELPELYLRISEYRDWIKSITGSASIFAPGVFTILTLSFVQLLYIKMFA